MITLKRDTIKGVLKWASDHPVVEVCGMVWQHNTSSVQTVVPLSNIHSEPDRYYAIDHKEMQQAYQWMAAQDCHLIAFYHSHPGGKPDPSEADMEGALNVGVHYLIAYPDEANAYPGTKSKHWRISAWDCIEMGILVGDDILEVRP
jgi:proteasome lid subunit RPN8/RPN11